MGRIPFPLNRGLPQLIEEVFAEFFLRSISSDRPSQDSGEIGDLCFLFVFNFQISALNFKLKYHLKLSCNKIEEKIINFFYLILALSFGILCHRLY